MKEPSAYSRSEPFGPGALKFLRRGPPNHGFYDNPRDEKQFPCGQRGYLIKSNQIKSLTRTRAKDIMKH